MNVDSVGVLGAGLIGGSLALRLRDLGVRVLVSDPDADTLAAAAEAGLETGDLAALAGCDLVVLAVPLDALEEAMGSMVALGAPLVIDVGSVKGAPARAAARVGLDAYVGCHPMSGSESSGFTAASADLLVGVTWAITRPEAPAASLLEPVVRWVLAAFDATVLVLDADEHDRAVALVSHAPHALANALLGLLESHGGPVAAHLAAGSFRDGTRVAGRNPVRTRNMLADNADALAGVLDELADALAAYRTELEQPERLLARLEAVAGGAAVVRTPDVAWRPCPDLTATLELPGPILLRPDLWAPLH